MCFYIYAPTPGSIKINFVHETITLDSEGKSEVAVDMLIENISSTPISELQLIYPNRFHDPKDHSKIGEYYDISSSLLDISSKYSWYYTSPRGEMNSTQLSNDSWATKLEIILPDPRDTSNLINLIGLLGGITTIEPYTTDLTELQWDSLNEVDATLFKANFQPAIVVNQKRWVRWVFKGVCASMLGKNIASCRHLEAYVNTSLPLRERTLAACWCTLLNYNLIPIINCINFYVKKFTDQLQFDYQICSPHDVIKRILAFLNIVKNRVNKLPSNSIERNAVLGDLSSLIYSIQTTTEKITEYEYIKISIRLKDIERLTDIVNYGGIEVAGTFPNYISDNDKMRPVYEWKAGKLISNSLEPSLSFSIIFQAKVRSLFYLLLPYWGIVLALIGIYLTIK